MNGFNAFLGGVTKGHATRQRGQSAFNASMMSGGAESVQAPAVFERRANRKHGENNGAESGSESKNLGRLFAGLNNSKRQEIKADLSRKGQIAATLSALSLDQQVIGIQTYGKEFGIDEKALQKAAANPAMALAAFSSSIQQAEMMLEESQLADAQDRPLVPYAGEATRAQNSANIGGNRTHDRSKRLGPVDLTEESDNTLGPNSKNKETSL